MTTPAPQHADPAPASSGVSRTSDKVDKLYTALVDFQSKVPAIYRDRTVDVVGNRGSYSFAYATLDNVLKVIRPILKECGLGFIQRVHHHHSTGATTLVTRLIHTSGQWEDTGMPLLSTFRGPQELGSAMTYAKRYGLTAALGLATDDDDDGNAEQGSTIVASSQAPNDANPEQTVRAYAAQIKTEIMAATSLEELRSIGNYEDRMNWLSTQSVPAYMHVKGTFEERERYFNNPIPESDGETG